MIRILTIRMFTLSLVTNIRCSFQYLLVKMKQFFYLQVENFHLKTQKLQQHNQSVSIII